MSEPTPLDPVLLAEAIEAARRSLRKLDDEHVPAKLRGLARRSGKLPLPLAKRLLVELDSSEWLRDEAAEELEATASRASFLFLRRPSGWGDELTGIVAHTAAAEHEAKARKLEVELRRSLEKLTRLEARLARSKERESKAEATARAKVQAEAAKRERSLAVRQDVLDRLRKDNALLEDKVEALLNDNSDLIERLSLLRSMQRRRTEPMAGPAPGPTWAPRDPVELARHLDDVMRTAYVPVRTGGQQDEPSTRTVVSLPAAIRPDHIESIYWLIDLREAAIVAIDGWNAAHHLKSPPGVTERDRVVEAARRIAIASRGRRSVVVVFDSSQGTDSFSTKELEVRFVPSADEELIDLAGTAPAGLVVITSDRRVREAVELSGAVGLWSEALIDWITTAGRRTFGV